ncbi:hypothetical protein JC1_29 [Burkholderia phage JC1]|nr:hypothetical protein JC1_29 [Burkholderia phage JC1]
MSSNLPPSFFSRGYAIATDKMLHIVVRDMGNKVDRIELAEYVDKPAGFPQHAVQIDIDEPRIRDIVNVSLERVGVEPNEDMIYGGCVYTDDAGLLHIAAWSCIAPWATGAPFRLVRAAA